MVCNTMNKSLCKGKPVDKDTCIRNNIMVLIFQVVILIGMFCYRKRAFCHIFSATSFSFFKHYKISMVYVHVVVNFLSQVIFIFLLFQLHEHTFPYPKTKEKLPERKN